MLACLVPQPDDVFPAADPFFLNRPPQIFGASPTQPLIETGNDATCGTLTFSIQVRDEDVNDSVKVRFYVDYNPTDNQGFEQESLFTNNGEPVRPEWIDYAPNFASANNPLRAVGDHLVEALVYDGSLGVDREPEDKPGPVDAGVNPSFAVYQRWTVRTVAGPCE